MIGLNLDGVKKPDGQIITTRISGRIGRNVRGLVEIYDELKAAGANDQVIRLALEAYQSGATVTSHRNAGTQGDTPVATGQSAGAKRSKRWREKQKAAKASSQSQPVTPPVSKPSRDTLSPTPPSIRIVKQEGSGEKEGKSSGDARESGQLWAEELPVRDEVKEAIEIYNSAAAMMNGILNQKMTPERRAKVKARLKDCGGLEGWRVLMERARASPYLRGEINGFRLSLKFLCQQESFASLMEGKYDDRKSPSASNGAQNLTDAERQEIIARLRA